MNFFLIKLDGEVNGFYVRECAELYQIIHGGVIRNWANMMSEGLDMETKTHYDACVGNDEDSVNKELNEVSTDLHESEVIMMHEMMEDELIESLSKMTAGYTFSDYYITEYDGGSIEKS